MVRITFPRLLSSAKARDVNESDTVVIVTDLLQYVFGYDKYSEITSEHMIRGTYCDLAVKIQGSLAFLLEVKAIGSELKDQHIKQAVDYAANQARQLHNLNPAPSYPLQIYLPA